MTKKISPDTHFKFITLEDCVGSGAIKKPAGFDGTKLTLPLRTKANTYDVDIVLFDFDNKGIPIYAPAEEADELFNAICLHQANLDSIRRIYESLGRGRHRETFKISDNLVFKVPTQEDGYDASYQEALYEQEFPTAKCELGYMLDMEVLYMEYVECAYLPAKTRPSWVDFVDCGQVGYTRDGRLVAYDWGF